MQGSGNPPPGAGGTRVRGAGAPNSKTLSKNPSRQSLVFEQICNRIERGGAQKSRQKWQWAGKDSKEIPRKFKWAGEVGNDFVKILLLQAPRQ